MSTREDCLGDLYEEEEEGARDHYISRFVKDVSNQIGFSEVQGME